MPASAVVHATAEHGAADAGAWLKRLAFSVLAQSSSVPSERTMQDADSWRARDVAVTHALESLRHARRDTKPSSNEPTPQHLQSDEAGVADPRLDCSRWTNL